MDRVIFHSDCNSFYSSVELLSRPELRDVPVAVCGDPESRHGIILAKNEPAKRFGVQTAETIVSAKRKCPDLVLLPSHHDLYRKYSKRVNAIYARYTEFVEPFGIDESWLDVTASWHLFGSSPGAVAQQLRRAVKAETGLTVSVGVSFNKVFAKLGSDYKKPDAVTQFTRENYKRVVWALPVTSLLYVGRSAAKTLAGLGIRTIGELAAADPAVLTAALGKLGGELSRYARGEDDSPVRSIYDKPEVKSVGNGLTFPHDLTDIDEARSALFALADEVASRLRAHGMWASSVQLSVKDPQMKLITRQAPLPSPVCTGRELAQAALALLAANWRFPAPVRALTVTALNLSHSAPQQLTLFDEGASSRSDKHERLEKSLDAIRGKYGHAAIAGASVLNRGLGLGKLSIDDPRKKRE